MDAETALKQFQRELSTIRTKMTNLEVETESDIDQVVEKVKTMQEEIEELRDSMEKIVRKYTKTSESYIDDILETNIVLRGRIRALDDKVEELSDTVAPSCV